jgi:hypothetical protein
MLHAHSLRNSPRRRFWLVAHLLSTALLIGLTANAAQPAVGGPRGKPIRPQASQPTNASPALPSAATIVTLPGGVIITNLPPELLPQTSNIVRLPTRAARKFEPLGYLPTSFTVLSRFFLKPPPQEQAAGQSPSARWEMVRQQIPEDVLSMDAKRVALAGFILPMSVVDGRSTEFLLLRTQGACCFGLVPRVNELVIVKMAPPGIVPAPDTPFVVAGKLAVKWIGEGGQLTAIYEMQAEKVERAAPF